MTDAERDIPPDLIRANELLAGGNFQRAAEAFDRFLSGDPQSLEALHGRALAALGLEKAADALPLLRRALFLAPLSPDVHHALGTALYRTGDAPGAADCFRAVLAISPVNNEARQNLIALLAVLGREGEAARYRKPPDDPEAESAFIDQADSWKDQGEDDKALKILAGLIETRPDNILARIERAGIFQKRGELEDYIAELAAITSAVPTYAQAWRLLGDNLSLLYRLRRSRQSALKRLDLDVTDSADEIVQRVQAVYERALSLHPEDAGALAGAGRLASDLGRQEQAQSKFEQALNGRPDLPDVRWRLSALYRELGETGKAAALFDGIDPTPDNETRFLVAAGKAYDGNGSESRAAGWFKAALTTGLAGAAEPMDEGA